jgi:ribosomal protein S27E
MVVGDKITDAIIDFLFRECPECTHENLLCVQPAMQTIWCRSGEYTVCQGCGLVYDHLRGLEW